MVLQTAIDIQGLTKQYPKMERPALEHLTLQVKQGEIFGYLGPNGAGKTTTIRMMLDLIRPTQGHLTLLGMDAQRDSVALHKRIGFLPGELALWQNLTGKEVIEYLSRLRGDVDMRYVGQLAEQLTLDLSKSVRSYSTGNRRKIGLVIALMSKPDLLILDEPTSGLDPLVQQTFNQMMLDVQAQGRTVFLSSHILSEVQAICERVGILRDGQLKAVEKVSDLTRVKVHHVHITLREAVDPQRLTALPGVSEISTEAKMLKFTLSGDLDPVLKALRDEYIIDIKSEEPSLEEIFLSFYGNGSNANREPSANGRPVKEMAR